MNGFDSSDVLQRDNRVARFEAENQAYISKKKNEGLTEHVLVMMTGRNKKALEIVETAMFEQCINKGPNECLDQGEGYYELLLDAATAAMLFEWDGVHSATYSADGIRTTGFTLVSVVRTAKELRYAARPNELIAWRHVISPYVLHEKVPVR